MKTIRTLVAVALLLAIGSGVASAVSTTVIPRPALSAKSPPNVKMWVVNLPSSFAVNDSCYVTIPSHMAEGLVALDSDGGGGGAVNFVLSFNAAAATDSVDTQIFAGPTSDGPWVSVSALAAETRGGLTLAAPFDVITDGALSTYSGMNNYRFLIKNKGATLTSKQYFITLFRAGS